MGEVTRLRLSLINPVALRKSCCVWDHSSWYLQYCRFWFNNHWLIILETCINPQINRHIDYMWETINENPQNIYTKNKWIREKEERVVKESLLMRLRKRQNKNENEHCYIWSQYDSDDLSSFLEKKKLVTLIWVFIIVQPKFYFITVL